MKETQVFLPDQIQATVQKQQLIRKATLIGKLRPKPGQKVYQWDMKSYSISEAKFDVVNAEILKGGTTKIEKRITVKDNHLYCCAINIKNAGKHFVKMIERLNKYNQ